MEENNLKMKNNNNSDCNSSRYDDDIIKNNDNNNNYNNLSHDSLNSCDRYVSNGDDSNIDGKSSSFGNNSNTNNNNKTKTKLNKFFNWWFSLSLLTFIKEKAVDTESNNYDNDVHGTDISAEIILQKTI